MTVSPVPLAGAVVGAVGAVPSAVASAAGTGRPLPMARLTGKRERSTVYGLTAVDARGRVADRTVTAALGWQPGDRLSLHVANGLIIVTAADDGLLAVK